MSSGGARPNAGRKKKDTALISIRVQREVAEAIRAYAREMKVTMAEAAIEILKKEG